MHAPDETPASALRVLRRYHAGTLAFDERISPVRFIIDGRNGRLVMPIEPVAADALEHVLYAPDQAGPEIEAILSPHPIEAEFDEALDRWAAYHGRTTERRWVSCDLETLRTGGWVYDGEGVMVGNLFRGDEPALVRRLNKDAGALASACRRVAGADVADPLAVGVDPDGVDVRARFGIVRLEFASPAGDADEAGRLIEAMLAGEGPEGAGA